MMMLRIDAWQNIFFLLALARGFARANFGFAQIPGIVGKSK